MDLFRAAERLMSMDDEVWARHANPWSVWTRFTCAPLLVLAIWSRTWIGWWALVPVALAILWTWYNPRAFPVPDRFDTWAGRGTRGERLYLNRHQIGIPAHHAAAAMALTALSGGSAVVMIWGLIELHVWATIAGTAGAMIFKAWFVDRMVWLYDDIQSGLNLPSPKP